MLVNIFHVVQLRNLNETLSHCFLKCAIQLFSDSFVKMILKAVTYILTTDSFILMGMGKVNF